ncbi:hypothetical protein QCD71_25460, partial [Sphingomonas sp. PsM26]|nr:hypothetical protein [Sphingomonas sp. PsM26]
MAILKLKSGPTLTQIASVIGLEKAEDIKGLPLAHSIEDDLGVLRIFGYPVGLKGQLDERHG